MALAIKITESSSLMDELLKQTSTGARKANSTAAVPGANAHKAQTLKARQKIGPHRFGMKDAAHPLIWPKRREVGLIQVVSGWVTAL